MASKRKQASDRFIRVPTTLLKALLRTRLTGVQWRLLFWIMRRTYGWNRGATPFTWYRIAIDTGITRPAIFRAGVALLKARILVLRKKQLAIETDSARWAGNPHGSNAAFAGQSTSLANDERLSQHR